MSMPPPPPKPHATADFESRSEAGLYWNGEKWVSKHGSNKPSDKGLSGVGAHVYAEHPSTDILTLSYRLPGAEIKRWKPGQPLPYDLFEWLASGGHLEAHNVMFERLLWECVCVPKYGFPPLPVSQLRCSMAKARVNAFPPALGNLTGVLKTPVVKDSDGKRLINKYSVPQKPTKKQPKFWLHPDVDDPETDGQKLYAYCDTDVASEELASAAIPDMSAEELAFWQVDQEINHRGVATDVASVRNMIVILDDALAEYDEEFAEITGGLGTGQVAETVKWLAEQGLYMHSLDSEAVEAALKEVTHGPVRRVLEIRQLAGSASVKKLYSLDRMASSDGRLRNILVHHGARTGRATGEGPQPQNLPKDGPDLRWCDECNMPSGAHRDTCAWCLEDISHKKVCEWAEQGPTNQVDAVQEVMATRSLEAVRYFFGDPLLAISGCIRGMFVAGEGMDLIASDFTAIEAVVAAALAGEEWRLDVFRQGRPIYLESASRITGTSVEAYLAYAKDNGHHHPDRNKIGKVAELALGFGGWIGGWRGFDDTDTFTDHQVKQNIIAWRNASPAIVEMWGGQGRGYPGSRNYKQEYYGLEGIFVQAVLMPGRTFEYRGIKAYMKGDALILRLLSGREMAYQSPRLTPSERRAGEYAITYMTWNTNPKYGPKGWIPMSTYSGKLFENVVQATAHDILRFAILTLKAHGYETVLHIHDEIVTEVPEGFGSVEEMEALMKRRAWWFADWPVSVDGGYRAKRYRK